MVGTVAEPTGHRERISELDVIRGFALFGVLWMNLYQHVGSVIPPEVVQKLPTAEVDRLVGLVGRWLMLGKAQALFSMLFGFGFAIFYDRVTARGVDATRLYLRRLTILLLIGLVHVALVWPGDILHQYALVGFLLLIVRRWPSWLLLLLGVPLASLLLSAAELGAPLVYGNQPPPWQAALTQAQEIRWEVFRQSDYLAYVGSNVRTVWLEFYAQPLGLVVLGIVLGRLLMGTWLYRQGWVQNPTLHAAGIRRWGLSLLGAGLVIAGIRPALDLAGRLNGNVELWTRPVADVAMPLLALGYAAGLILICQSPTWAQRMSGLAAVGRMALTNYVAQSLMYIFVLYGFGLGLMRFLGATAALGLAILFFAAQIVFSRWWLARYRFGPLEWLWRSATYGRWQPMRGAEAPPLPAR